CFISSSLCHHTYLFIFFTLLPPPPTSTLFPYTTLFRSRHELHLRPLVVDVGDVRFVEHGLQQVRRNEVDAFPVAEDDIAGHHRRIADTDGRVDGSEHHVADCRGMRSAEIDAHRDRENSLQVADGAVDNQAPS